MPRNYVKELVVLIMIFSLGGCGWSMKTYTQEEDREDLEVSGNAGYLYGKPENLNQGEVDKTRTRFVVEFMKHPTEDLDIDKIEPAQVPPVSINVPEPSRRPQPQPSAVNVNMAPEAPRETTYSDYTIEKNDTLQKISKKFYGSYSKWTRIYDVNKDIISDPNRIKPGLTIRIPQE